MNNSLCCKGWIRTTTRSLAKGQCAHCGQPIILRLSDVSHPRDRRVCLPISTPYSIVARPGFEPETSP